MSVDTPLWKKFEQDIFDYLLEKEEHEPMLVHRFYDTHSAGDFLPAQPGDFLVVKGGHSILIEAKHSVKHKSLRACFSSHVKNEQIGQHIIWQRAGATTLFLFKSEAEKDRPVIEVWDGQYLIKARTSGSRLKLSSRIGVSESLEGAMAWVFTLHIAAQLQNLGESSEDSRIYRPTPGSNP